MKRKTCKSYRSPPLTLSPDGVWLCTSGEIGLACTRSISDVIIIPQAAVYWISLRTTRWADGSGSKFWVRGSWSGWYWGLTQQQQNNNLLDQFEEALDSMNLPKNRPVRLWGRLEYED